MKRALFLTVAAFSLALMACIPDAQAADGFSLSMKGIVESVDAARERFVVRIARLPKPLTLAWDKDTRFQRGEELSAATSLAAGQEIEIRYRLSSGKRHHAIRIVILSAPDGNKEAALSQ
jgi:hypothetical protein